MQIPERDTASIEDACKLAHVSRRTIYNWMASKKIECIRTAGGNVRIYTDTLFKPYEPVAK